MSDDSREGITPAEQKRQEEKRGDRYAVMAELSADIAHEFRNPLGSIKLLASLLKKELKRKKDLHRLDQILAAVGNMENKISSLIQFSKIYRIPSRLVNVHDTLREILSFPGSQAGTDLPFISSRFADCEPLVECNPEMLKQVLLTLTLNILQALPDTSRLDIETRRSADQQQIEVHFIGKDMESQNTIRSQVHNPFSWTEGNQWGLGLAIIHNIINLYRGSLRLEYLQSVGVSFVLAFPLTTREERSPAVSPLG
ncbi:MAG: hypothetical protein FWE89_04720 [Syntrophaceae bacterium]|nr:hypothetical protein [Syntrophaceae bacterium]